VDRFDRIYRLDSLLRNARRPVPRDLLLAKLECSRATLCRIIEDMRDFLGAPIVYDRARNGYRYDKDLFGPYELPGLWLDAHELYALLALHQLLSSLQPGLLDSLLAPLRRRVEELLRKRELGSGEIVRRVRLLSMAARRGAGEHFQTLARALLGRRRLQLRYHGRARDQVSERAVSPQRLVYYRDNWYLDAWCHRARGLRTFSLERVLAARVLPLPARDVPEPELDAHFASSYGIFAGTPRATAVLRFTPERTRWVADERWHRDQQGTLLPDGSYELRVPYGDPRELAMDILKYGPDLEVLAPEELRTLVAERLETAARHYRTVRPRGPSPRRKPPALAPVDPALAESRRRAGRGR
jgi:proteasome accessory factor C